MKILKDLRAYSGGGSFLKGIYHFFLNSNFQMIFWYRIAHALGRIHLSFISKIIMYFHKLVYAVDIDYRCRIGGGFKIVHGMAIVIGKDVKIGDNVTIYQSVTLGGNGERRKIIDGKETGQPVLHNGVKVFSGACIIGPVLIGENSIVGAHTVITSDVAPNTSVHTVVNRVEHTIN